MSRTALSGLLLAGGTERVVVGVFVVLVGAGLNHPLPHSVEVNQGEEVVEALALLVELYKELLGVAARLGARPRAHVLLHALPFLAVELECLNEAEVLVHGPAASLFAIRIGAGIKGLGRLREAL